MKPILIFTAISLILANNFTIQAQSQKEQMLTPDSLQNVFDFWVGNWEVSWATPDSSLVKGINRVEKILDGKVIQENFIDPSRNFKGTSISVYNPRSGSWYQAWADNRGGYYNFIGEFENDKRIFIMEEFDPTGARYRMVFSDIKPDSFTWKWQGIREGWENWQTVWQIFYKRISEDKNKK